MNALQPRRFRHLHEQVLLSTLFSGILGWIISVFIPYVAFWSYEELLNPNEGQKTALIVTTCAYIISHVSVKKIQHVYPGGRSIGFIAPQTVGVYVILTVVVFFFRPEISRYLLLSSGAVALIWLHIDAALSYKYKRLKLAVINNSDYCAEILKRKDIDPRLLKKLDLEAKRYDAVIVDFNNLTPDIERFLTHCALNRTAVYDAKQIHESLSGRVKIRRMSENNIGSLLPSPWYEKAKQILDCAIVLITLPVTLLIGIIVAILIKVESPGPVIYKQKRIGQGNRTFIIYKFRSMRFDKLEKEQFAGADDPRITKIGAFIRKTRIDELPQFINILKGDMSLVGPRPEQPSFVEDYNRLIPFYSYRHIVKPGITGWAQVRHGYTASSDETSVKIEHDFYYIKNYSFSMDLMILILTIKIIMTGFGAR